MQLAELSWHATNPNYRQNSKFYVNEYQGLKRSYPDKF